MDVPRLKKGLARQLRVIDYPLISFFVVEVKKRSIITQLNQKHSQNAARPRQ